MLFPFFWLLVASFLLVILQRWTHRHLHGLAYLLTFNKNWAVILYAIALLPGVFLHEFSHWLAANLLGVKTGSFSILPKSRSGGVIQLGAVEYYKPGSVSTLRETIIGIAPLLTGTLAIFLVATRIFDVEILADAVSMGSLDNITVAFNNILSTKDLWVWLYLLFTISNTMIPSTSDRKTWPMILAAVTVLVVLIILLGIGEALWAEVSQPVSSAAGFFSLALTVALLLDLIVLPFLILFEAIVARLRGVRLVLGE
jgi:hypothetical protein